MINQLARVAALLLALSPATVRAESFGACAWARVPSDEKSAFLNAYRQSIQTGTQQLGTVDAMLRGKVAECIQRVDIPGLWVQASVASIAVQYGAASVLKSSLNIDRATLEATWASAPASARDCTRANAAKAFGLNSLPCADKSAPALLLRALSITPMADRADAAQALYFFNAKAQEDWAQTLITRFLRGP